MTQGGCTDEEPRKAPGLTGPAWAGRLTRRRAAGLVLAAEVRRCDGCR